MAAEATISKHDKEQALRDLEEAIHVVAVCFGGSDDPAEQAVRRIVLKARGDVRETLGEGRS